MSRPSEIRPVILCGGSGTRLWPLSRPEFPKQFLTLKGDTSLLEQTLSRAAAVSGGATPILIAATQHQDLVAETLSRCGAKAELIFEPVARNTAPAIAAAALIATRHNPDDILVVMPSDHIVDGIEDFVKSVEGAADLARQGWITILGVVPSEPSSALGYIVPGEAVSGQGWRVDRFVEKPPREFAEELVRAGAFWNAGMVVARAQDVIDALRRHEPKVLAAVEASLGLESGANECHLGADAFATAPKISFDYAVLEKHERVAVTPLHAAWRDVGTWNEVASLHTPDKYGNRIIGDVHLSGGKENFIRSTDRRILALGVEDLVIVDSPDSLLVAKREHLPSLSQAVQDLPQLKPISHNGPKADWGDVFEVLQDSSSSVRKFIILPGKATSEALHGELGGHWIVTSGRGVAKIGARTCGLDADESVALSTGEARWIANIGDGALEVIEVLLQRPAVNTSSLRKVI